LIYPHTHDQQKAKGVTDEDLDVVLKICKLEYITEREGGWETTNDWNDVLSGGEK